MEPICTCDDEYIASCSASEIDSDDESQFEWVACTLSATDMVTNTNSTEIGYAVHTSAPSLEEIGNPANLNSYLPGSGATQHMTSQWDDLYDAVEGQKLRVEVADGHIIHCSTTSKVHISMTEDNGNPLEAKLHGCMYVPGLSRHLFSITKFANNGHRATITRMQSLFTLGPRHV